MKLNNRKAGVISIILFLPLVASAEVNCFKKDSTFVITPDRHCSKKCGGWADKQPVEYLQMTLSDQLVGKGAFFKDPVAKCEGLHGCGFTWIGTPTSEGAIVKVAYKTWSRSTTIRLEADVCVLE